MNTLVKEQGGLHLKEVRKGKNVEKEPEVSEDKEKNNIVNMDGKEIDPKYIIALQEKHRKVNQLLDEVRQNDLVNLLIVGQKEDGIFLMDSEKNIMNANYLLSAGQFALHDSMKPGE